MLSDASGSIGNDIRLEDRASKGSSGRVIPMNRELREALSVWRAEQNPVSEHVVSTERSSRTTPQAIVNMFSRWYSDLRFVGCSSHSGRRTFITNAARKIYRRSEARSGTCSYSPVTATSGSLSGTSRVIPKRSIEWASQSKSEIYPSIEGATKTSRCNVCFSR